MSTNEGKHVLVVSLPAYGHLIPAIALASRISRYHRVIFPVPNFIVQHARRKGALTSRFEDQVHVTVLDDGIPITIPEPEAFRMAMMKGPLTDQLLSLVKDRSSMANPVNAVILDSFLGKLVPLFAELGVKVYFYNTFASICFNRLLAATPDTPVDDSIDFRTSFNVRTDPTDPIHSRIKERSLAMVDSLPCLSGILFNTCAEMDPPSLDKIRERPDCRHLKLFCVGPLLDDVPIAEDQESESQLVMQWLDKQTKDSVIYASFGSTPAQSENSVRELGCALELLKKPFVLSLAAPFHRLLPEGVLKAKGEAGLILNWVPQKLVLAHPAVQVFISHCGWNSTTESLHSGKPIVAWPTFGDQLDNSIWVERIGAGKCLIAEESRTSAISKQPILAKDVVEAVNEVCGSDCSRMAKEWARKIRQSLNEGGSSAKDLQKFLSSL